MRSVQTSIFSLFSSSNRQIYNALVASEVVRHFVSSLHGQDIIAYTTVDRVMYCKLSLMVVIH